ncbi:GlcNAc-PI de-N-acetylase [Longimycelium tulufanense]|uniref:GlcNAc-PI de-N-acetylase n=2 Tax=Longimycelium tulufanense TaxID=907463 RepID=A0A8J3CB84_9PSEU|nr:GlcNAc-PI de-N-acetylase [Longimycelium tulufanense]
MPEEWSTAVCVLAHPDDMEYGPATAVARWTAQGKTVSYVFISSGEAGIQGMHPDQAGPLREREERAAAPHVGVEDLEFLHYPDFAIQNTPELRRDITQSLQRRDPELLMILNHHEQWAFGGSNSTDHRNAGNAVLQAIRENPLPHLRWVAVADSTNIDHAVDVTDTLEAGLAALREHRAYLEALGGELWSIQHVVSNARRAGKLFGTRYAAAFELIELEPRRPQD